MRSIRKWFWSLMVLSMGVAIGAQGETLALWDFEDVTTASGVSAGLDASAVAVSAGTINFQNGADDGGSRIANSSGWNQDEFDVEGKYLEFSVSTLAGYELDLTEVTIRLGRTGAGPTEFTAQYSLDGFATAGAAAGSGAVTSEAAGDLDPFTLSAPAEEFSGTITYRIWGHDATGTGNLRFNNFRVIGSVDLLAGEFPPSIVSPSASDITDTSVTLSADIAATGGVDVFERGFVYSTTQGFDPINDGLSETEDEGPYGTGIFSLPVTGLDPDTVYYFVGYAINSEGTAYTAEASFRTVPEPPDDALVYFTFTGDSVDAEFVAADVSAEPFEISAGNVGFGWFPATAAEDWENLGGAEPYAQGSGGWGEADQASAKNFFVELTADVGESMTITNISFLHRRTGAGPEDTGVSIDGVSIHTEALPETTVVAVSIPVTGYVDVTSAVVSFEGWNGGGGLYQIDNVLIQGTTDDPGPTPEPDPVEVTGFSFVGAAPTATFTAEEGLNYYLVYTTDLTAVTSVEPPVLSEWVVANSIIDAEAGAAQLEDSDPAEDARFYGILVTVDPL